MPITPFESICHSTVRISCTYADDKVGTGTGFIFGFDPTDSGSKPCIVTNKHVVAGAIRGAFALTATAPDGSPSYGVWHSIEVQDFEHQWILHPDPQVDLAAMPIAPILRSAQASGFEPFYRQFGPQFILSEGEEADLIGGESVVMVGYPNGLWDEVNNMPVVRRGNLASLLHLDWDGKREFLVDIPCFPGSSGSPVMIFDEQSYRTKRGVHMGSYRIKLLGVLYAGPVQPMEGTIQFVNIPTIQVPIPVTHVPINLGLVIKAGRILELPIDRV